MAKNKVLFITNKIPHYRLPLYEELGKRYDLTIAHTGNLVKSECFTEITSSESSYGLFIKYSGIPSLAKYDVIILYANVRLLNLYYSIIVKSKYNLKIILFGIGVSASYNKYYDRDKRVGFLLKEIVKRIDAAIFYDFYPVIKYSSMGVNPKKLFVAPNTVVGNMASVAPRSQRDSIMFIGSLYRQKGIQLLLDAYYKLVQKKQDVPTLNIIGDGPEKQLIMDWIASKSLSHKIKLLGSIIEEDILSSYFSKAICCVSPGQAGLSVQKSFSYGVPFITSHYPISGGEFTSIIEGVTGYYYDGTVEDLANKINFVINDPNLDEIIKNCNIFYRRFRSPKLWIDGFSSAIEFVLNS